MECNVREISNAVMIDSLDTIIEQENRKLEMDKNTGLLARKSKVLKAQQPLKENENIPSQNTSFLKDFKSHSPKLNPSCDRVNEIERLANLFTESPSFFATINNNNINVNQNQMLLKGTMTTQTHNEFDHHKVLLNNKSNNNLISPDLKVKRNVRFGEFSPLNPANQVTSHPFLGIGEYDDKRKKIQELQRKEYVEYLSKIKQDKNTSNLPKLPEYSCEEALKTAMEDGSSSEQNQLNRKSSLIQLAPFVNRVESCAFDDEQKKESNRLKQELYRLELNKQIEEKKILELERKQKEQMDDEAIERAAKDQEEKIKKEFEKESEKRILAQFQKELQQEKLKNELMERQRDLGNKLLNVPSEIISQQVSKYIPSGHGCFENNDDVMFNCPPQSPFDNVPLPTTRIRVPRKMVYEDKIESINKTKNLSCNTDTFTNPSCMNQSISPPIPATKTLIIDSPLKLAITGLNDCEEDRTCEAIKPTKGANRNMVSQQVLLGNNHKLLTDKHLLSNLGNIRKQLVIEHQKLKQQVRLSQ